MRDLKRVLGQGLLTSEGELWRRQRKLAQPAFHRERMDGFAQTMARATAEMLARWRDGGGGATICTREMMQLTLRDRRQDAVRRRRRRARSGSARRTR